MYTFFIFFSIMIYGRILNIVPCAILEKAMASHSILLPGKSHGRRSLEGCSPWGRWGSDKTEWLHFHFLLSCIGEGNGNPLHWYSSLLLFILPLYNSLCLLIPNSQSIHPHLLHLCGDCKSFSMSVSLFLFLRKVHVSCLRFHIEVISYDICLSLSDLLHLV